METSSTSSLNSQAPYNLFEGPTDEIKLMLVSTLDKSKREEQMFKIQSEGMNKLLDVDSLFQQ